MAKKALKRKLPPPVKPAVKAADVPTAPKKKKPQLTEAQAEYKKVYPNTVYPEER